MAERLEHTVDHQRVLDFIFGFTENINEHSSNGKKYLKGILTSVVTDMSALIHIAKTKPLNLRGYQVAYQDYVKHIKRFFIIEVYSMAESRTREIAKERSMVIEGRAVILRNLINQALLKIRSKEARKLLNKALKLSGGDFVEFHLVLSYVLRERLSRKETSEWLKFFTVFGAMRNAVHNNFLVQKSLDLKNSKYNNKLVEGDTVRLFFEDFIPITKALLDFFDIIEN